ncbi:hypothetical protein B0J13DRAFT_538772 [Dactylonectria estremocensis]|uniref:Uncharacterized protein n=1 Tax=Dactylonectria estremocensis TaxID=1079267 RepID=A0A9P9JJ54_9HYPO|nr:hypothetical protein B0J13DRAFT_538772 [Dactylonectria estremocensis]
MLFRNQASEEEDREEQGGNGNDIETTEKAKQPVGWKPLLLSTPVLLGVTALSLTLFAAVETLAQLSQARGGLALSPSQDDISKSAMISYLYGPMIIAVVFSMLWNWIDLDVKRIQPWMELSRPTGATAEDSVLLDYPSDFIALAPIRAARRKHWPVFLSGFAVVLIFWVMTPLQSSLLGIASSTQTISATAVNRSRLLPREEQKVNTRFTNMAYAIGWLGQSYPAFATKDYALLPFYVNDDVDDASISNTQRNWTAETKKLWSEFSCSPAIVSKAKGKSQYNFQGIGCNASLRLDATSFNVTVAYMDNLPDIIYNQTSYSCNTSSDTLYSALVYWYKRLDNSSDEAPLFNITAMHCDLFFHEQQVLATVTSGDLQPVHDSIKPLSEPTNLTSKEIDMDSYLRSLPTFQTRTFSSTEDLVNRQFPEMRALESATNISVDLNPIFRYAIAERNESVEVLLDPSQLQGLVQGVHKQLFSLSITDRLTNDSTTTANSTATSTFYLTGIVVSRAFAAVLESLLLLVTLMAVMVLYFARTSASALTSNPSSISQLMDIAHNSPEVADLFRPLDTASEKSIARSLEGTMFQLVSDPVSKCNELVATQKVDASAAQARRDIPPRCYYKPIKPWVLRRGTGCAFAVVLTASIVVLSVLKAQERKLNGLSLPSNNFEVLQLLENYIPTVIATLFESFWIYLTRTMCIFQPFMDLCEGRSQAANSIAATYSTVPPQLAIFGAIKSRHIMLTLLCLAAILADVLAVSLGAVFNEKPVTVEYPQAFQPLYKPQFNDEVLLENAGINNQITLDFLAITLANMSYNSQLSPWTSTEYFFLPHSIAKAEESSPNDEYTLRTRGFGIDANCTSIPASTHIFSEQYLGNTTSNTTIEACEDQTRLAVQRSIDYGLQWPSTNVSASLEGALFPYTDNLSLPCTPPITVAWTRAPDGVKENATFTISYAVCRPIFETAMFDVTVDEEGYVLGYKRVSSIGSTLNYPNSKNHTKSFVQTLNGNAIGYSTRWRNNTSTGTWLGEFMVWENGNRDSLDPSLPVPDPTEQIPALNRVYSRLFAAFLGVQPDFLERTENEEPIKGKRSGKETRIMMDNTACIISLCVLCIDLVIVLAFYLPKTLYVLPRVPTTIGSVLAYIVPSRAVQNGAPPSGWKDQTFSFGRYVASNGRSYVGVEMDPHVLHKNISFKVTGS